ncbi:MAG: extracellular solute-binding protein [Cypionkella sp.]
MIVASADDRTKSKAAYYPHIVATVTFDGNQWGVPVAFSTKAFYWNKDLFTAAGLDPEKPPTTWAETIAIRQGRSRKRPASRVTACPPRPLTTPCTSSCIGFTPTTAQVIDAAGNITLDSPQDLAALQAYKDITPYSVEGATAYEQNEIRAIFLDGKVGMIAGFGRRRDTCSRIPRSTGASPICRPARDAKGPGTLLITD